MISRKLKIGCSFKYDELRLAIEHVDILAICCACNIIFCDICCFTSASLRMSYLKSVVNCYVFCAVTKLIVQTARRGVLL